MVENNACSSSMAGGEVNVNFFFVERKPTQFNLTIETIDFNTCKRPFCSLFSKFCYIPFKNLEAKIDAGRVHSDFTVVSLTPFLNALWSYYNSNRIDVLGRKYVFWPFSEMSLSRTKNVFTPANISSIVVLYHVRE